MMMMMPNLMYTCISTICKHFPFLQNPFRLSHSSHCDFADHFAIVLVPNRALDIKYWLDLLIWNITAFK